MRRYDCRRVKKHRSYTVAEVEKLLGVHAHTVRRWITNGLRLVCATRPVLIHGEDLRSFLAERQPAKQPLRPGMIFCVGCRAPRSPAGDIADYVPHGVTYGSLVGICPDCESIIQRRVSRARIHDVRGDLDVLFSELSIGAGV
ncbi:helix-turn-helix domain-containing protein [Methylocystis sp. H62]|uniref:helix-turn-helix domain-containing protein n=1 Tax=Methylocystis sp. H62 TaxID=2785789 RepID=UPI0018C20D4A|nr:helix-turn-helix domain-containing protein [Methylocystis sp. H62]